MEFDTLYEIDSFPLKGVDDIMIGKEYCTGDGVTVKYVDEDSIEIVKRSPLVDGELMENLTEKQLGMFWKLRSRSV